MMLKLLLVSLFTLVELNCENLFDCRHDTLCNDYEYLPDAVRHWTHRRYWQKLNNIGQEIIACGEMPGGQWALPDLVALSEVENDSVLFDLSRRSLLRRAGYEYVMTHSPDERGIDVALLYSPFTFRLLRHHALRIEPPEGHHPTRDVLYVSGEMASGDTLHVYVVHAPSRYGGERANRPYRLKVASALCSSIDSLRRRSPQAPVIVAGDFNEYAGEAALRFCCEAGLLTDVSERAMGSNGAKGTYRYQGRWGSLDHILVSASLACWLQSCTIFDAAFLLEPDKNYGGMQPRRNYRGMRYNNGFSDHLPLVARFRLPERVGED